MLNLKFLNSKGIIEINRFNDLEKHYNLAKEIMELRNSSFQRGGDYGQSNTVGSQGQY